MSLGRATFRTCFGWLLLCAGAFACADVPKMFVVQLVEDSEKFPDFQSLILDSYLAGALDEIGQVDSVVWSLSDARFREVAGRDSFPLEWNSPSEQFIVPVAREVGAEYTLVVWCQKTDAVVRPVATLYRGKGFRKIWSYGDYDRRMAPFYTGELKPLNEDEFRKFKDLERNGRPEFAPIMVGREVDWDSTSRTIARTFAALIQQGPLKGLPAKPKQNLPDADPGDQVPLPVGVRMGDAGMGLEAIDVLVEKGEVESAIVQLRDMIDREPFRDDFRLRLGELLESEGLYVEAAREAVRSAQVVKKPAPFYRMAAKNWLRSGHLDQARDALNNLLARGGEDRESRGMMGELYLREGNAGEAIEWYSSAIRSGPTPDVVYGRAVAYALSGQIDLCRGDLASLVDLPADRLSDSYVMAVTVCTDLLEGVGVRIRDRVALHKIHRTDPELVALTARDTQLAESITAFIELTPVPSQFAGSHVQRALAHKLMVQGVTEVFEYATTRKEDLASEGTLSLGEALRMLPALRSLFERERSKTALN